MTNRDITLHYATCTAFGIAVALYTQSIALGIAAFIAISALMVRESETRQRP